jgi:hypothetical protein
MVNVEKRKLVCLRKTVWTILLNWHNSDRHIRVESVGAWIAINAFLFPRRTKIGFSRDKYTLL